MKKEHIFPTDLTPDEMKSGFGVEGILLPLNNRPTAVAVLPLSSNTRLIKMRNLMAVSDEFGYTLLAHCRVLPNMPFDKPKWQFVWTGMSFSIVAAIRRYSEGVPSNYLLSDPPSDPQPIRN
jgi:hypothetical protein